VMPAELSPEEIEYALGRLAQILAGEEREDVAETAVHVWRVEPAEWSERIVRLYLAQSDDEYGPEMLVEWLARRDDEFKDASDRGDDG
jgi:hypothetical protein